MNSSYALFCSSCYSKSLLFNQLKADLGGSIFTHLICICCVRGGRREGEVGWRHCGMSRDNGRGGCRHEHVRGMRDEVGVSREEGGGKREEKCGRRE